MGDAIGKIIEELMIVIKKYYKKPKMWLAILAVVILFVAIIPYIDYNFFYFSRMEKRIDILAKVMDLDQEKINDNQVYNNEYHRILQEMEQQNEYSIDSTTNRIITFMAVKDNGNKIIKFISGAFWLILIMICIPFMNTFKNLKEKVMAFILFLILSVIVGGICMVIPTIISPKVNYFAIPLLEIIIGYWISRTSEK